MNLEIIEIKSSSSTTAKAVIEYDEEFEILIGTILHKKEPTRLDIERYVARSIERALDQMES